MFFYAQLDKNNICFGISQLSGEVNAPNMILLESYDASLLGKKYNNGTWAEISKPEYMPEQLSATEQAALQTAINIEYMLSMMEIKG